MKLQMTGLLSTDQRAHNRYLRRIPLCAAEKFRYIKNLETDTDKFSREMMSKWTFYIFHEEQVIFEFFAKQQLEIIDDVSGRCDNCLQMARITYSQAMTSLNQVLQDYPFIQPMEQLTKDELFRAVSEFEQSLDIMQHAGSFYQEQMAKVG